MTKSTLARWILEHADGEPVEAVVIGEGGQSTVFSKGEERPRGKVMPWAEAEPWLRYEFDSWSGSPGCEAIYAWTKTKVMFVSQYDGATYMSSVPRDPAYMEGLPGMPGS